MKLFTLGVVGRPRGYKGEFVLSRRDCTDPLPEGVPTLHLGPSPDQATPYALQESKTLPKGISLKLEGVDSDTQVRALSGQYVFLSREWLPETEPDEYYTGDLLGCEVKEASSGRTLGTLVGVEAVGRGAPDRWWVEGEKGRFALPATAQTISSVEPENRVIWVRDVSELLPD